VVDFWLWLGLYSDINNSDATLIYVQNNQLSSQVIGATAYRMRSIDLVFTYLNLESKTAARRNRATENLCEVKKISEAAKRKSLRVKKKARHDR